MSEVPLYRDNPAILLLPTSARPVLQAVGAGLLPSMLAAQHAGAHDSCRPQRRSSPERDFVIDNRLSIYNPCRMTGVTLHGVVWGDGPRGGVDYWS